MTGSGILTGVGSGVVVAVVIFLITLAILWFCFPFAVFGTKPILRNILHTQRLILAELRAEPRKEADKSTPLASTPARETVSSFYEVVTCADCGRETYGGQETCPHCKQPLRFAPRGSDGPPPV